MNINQALRRISVIKGDLSSWTSRLKNSVSWRENKSPAWTLEECVTQIETLTTELIDLESRVTSANVKAKISWNNETITLAKAIRTLAQIKASIDLYKGLTGVLNEKEATFYEEESKYDITSRSYIELKKEYKQFCSITERERSDKVKSLQQNFDKLNELVEGQNHQVKI